MNVKHNESPKTAINVFAAKTLPTCFLARNMKGMFSMKMASETETGVRKDIRREMPVIPPSIKPLGIRKLLSPKPATRIPRIMKMNSLIKIKIKLYTLFIGYNQIIIL